MELLPKYSFVSKSSNDTETQDVYPLNQKFFHIVHCTSDTESVNCIYPTASYIKFTIYFVNPFDYLIQTYGYVYNSDDTPTNGEFYPGDDERSDIVKAPCHDSAPYVEKLGDVFFLNEHELVAKYAYFYSNTNALYREGVITTLLSGQIPFRLSVDMETFIPGSNLLVGDYVFFTVRMSQLAFDIPNDDYPNIISLGFLSSQLNEQMSLIKEYFENYDDPSGSLIYAKQWDVLDQSQFGSNGDVLFGIKYRVKAAPDTEYEIKFHASILGYEVTKTFRIGIREPAIAGGGIASTIAVTMASIGAVTIPVETPSEPFSRVNVDNETIDINPYLPDPNSFRRIIGHPIASPIKGADTDPWLRTVGESFAGAGDDIISLPGGIAKAYRVFGNMVSRVEASDFEEVGDRIEEFGDRVGERLEDIFVGVGETVVGWFN